MQVEQNDKSFIDFEFAFTEDIIWLRTVTEGWPSLLCHTSDSFTLDRLTFVLDLQLEDTVLFESEEIVLSEIEQTLLQTEVKQDTKDWALGDFDFTLDKLS